MVRDMVEREDKWMKIVEFIMKVMNEKWGSGNPNQGLTNLNFMAYDDHRYLKWAYGEQDTQSWYLNTACNDDRGGNWPTSMFCKPVFSIRTEKRRS